MACYQTRLFERKRIEADTKRNGLANLTFAGIDDSSDLGWRHPSLAAVDSFCQASERIPMTSMNISLPEELKEYVESQTKSGYSTPSEFVRE